MDFLSEIEEGSYTPRKNDKRIIYIFKWYSLRINLGYLYGYLSKFEMSPVNRKYLARLFKSSELDIITSKDRFLIVITGHLKDTGTSSLLLFSLMKEDELKGYLKTCSWNLVKISGLPDNFSPPSDESMCNTKKENKDSVQEPKGLSLKEIKHRLNTGGHTNV